MEEYKNVIGSTDSRLYVGKTTVYVRSNIEPYKELDEETGEVIFEGYKYNEIQYPLREFHELIASKSEVNEEYIVDVDFRLSLIEMGIV